MWTRTKLWLITTVLLLFLSWYFIAWQPNNTVATDHKLLEENFDTLAPGAFGRAVIAHRYTELTAAKGINQSSAIKVNYEGYERGSKRVVVSSAVAATNNATLSFSVRFCPDFDFGRGGKMHGLGPAKPVAGGNAVTDDRWSARLMWRRNGGLMTYVYHHDMKGKYGDTQVAPDFSFNPGQYYLVQMTVSLNTQPELADGYIEVQVDGKPVIQHNQLRFRTTNTADGLINRVMFNTFHGGSSPLWAPRNADGSFKTDCAFFDDFEVIQAVAKPVGKM